MKKKTVIQSSATTSTLMGFQGDAVAGPSTKMSFRSSVKAEQLATASERVATAAGARASSTPAPHGSPSTDMSVHSGASDGVREQFKPASTHGHQ